MATVARPTIEFVKTYDNGATETIVAELHSTGHALVHVDALAELLGRLGFARVPQPVSEWFE
jgi:hypothetical protein